MVVPVVFYHLLVAGVLYSAFTIIFLFHISLNLFNKNLKMFQCDIKLLHNFYKSIPFSFYHNLSVHYIQRYMRRLYALSYKIFNFHYLLYYLSFFISFFFSIFPSIFLCLFIRTFRYIEYTNGIFSFTKPCFTA